MVVAYLDCETCLAINLFVPGTIKQLVVPTLAAVAEREKPTRYGFLPLVSFFSCQVWIFIVIFTLIMKMNDNEACVFAAHSTWLQRLHIVVVGVGCEDRNRSEEQKQ